MAKFQVDPSSESSSVNGDASPRTPPTPCLQGQGNGSYCTSMLCTLCVEMRNLPDSNSNATSGLFGQRKSDRPDSKLDASAPLFGASPSNPPTQRSACCDTCYLSSCSHPKNDKPESSANASTSLIGARCKTCNKSFCLCPKDKKPDSQSDAPAAGSEAPPCTGFIPITEKKVTVCTKCFDLFCPNATTTVGPPLCPICHKPGCLGGMYKPDAFANPHWSPKSNSGSLFASGSPHSHGLPKGENPDFKALNAKFEALEAKCDDLGAGFDALGAKVEALRVHMKSEFESLDSKFDVLIRNMDDVVEKIKKL